MNDIRDLLPGGKMRERTFQLKARRDVGVAWTEPQFVECKQCGRRTTRQIWAKSFFVCPNCGFHLPIGGYYRLSLVLDHGSFRELDESLPPQDVLHFPGYPEKLAGATAKTGLSEAAVTAVGRIGGVACVAAVLDSRFFMGSMSTAVGDKITRAIEHATAKRLPLVIFSASGGARMQEGIFSLMQNLLREFHRQFIASDNRHNIYAWIIYMSKYFDNLAFRFTIIFSIICNLTYYFVA